MRSPAFTTKIAAGLALAVALAGCGPVNRSLNSVHQPVVSRTDYLLDLAVSGDGLAPGEDKRLEGWFDTLRLGYGDRIAIDDPSPYGHGGRREAIAAVAARYGLLLSDDAPVTAGPIAPQAVRIVISRSAASVPGCPDWSRASQPEFAASTMSNYGCATNANLAAMIADPQDLVRGQESVRAVDANAATKAIRTYRDADPTGKGGLKQESTGGK